MFPGQCGNTAFFFKSQPDQFHFEFRGIVFPGKSFFSAHEVSTCKISGCLSYRILDSGPDGTQTTLTNIPPKPYNETAVIKIIADTIRQGFDNGRVIAERINEAGYQTKAGKAWDKDIYSAWKRQGSNAEKLSVALHSAPSL
ncbi:hypothetical protein AB2P85_14895 [Escherichia coli]